MHFNFAFFGSNIADRFFKNHSYGTTLIAGHSLGGGVATSYALGHREDLCLAKTEYEAGRVFWPATAKEVVIDGGNHSGFADYGAQKGDGTAYISNDAQQQQTASAVLELWKF